MPGSGAACWPGGPSAEMEGCASLMPSLEVPRLLQCSGGVGNLQSKAHSKIVGFS